MIERTRDPTLSKGRNPGFFGSPPGQSTLPPSVFAASLILHALFLLLVLRPVEPEPETVILPAVSIVWSRQLPVLAKAAEPPAPTVQALPAAQAAIEPPIAAFEISRALDAPQAAEVKPVELSPPVMPLEQPSVEEALLPPISSPVAQPVVSMAATAVAAPRSAKSAAIAEAVVPVPAPGVDAPPDDPSPVPAGPPVSVTSVVSRPARDAAMPDIVPSVAVEADEPAPASPAPNPTVDFAPSAPEMFAAVQPMAAQAEMAIEVSASISPAEIGPAERLSNLPPGVGTDAEIAAALAKVSCAGVAGEHDPSTGTVRLSGYVQREADRDLLRRLTSAIPGVAAVDISGLMLLPPPHCTTLVLLAELDISASADQVSVASLVPTAPQSAFPSTAYPAGAGRALGTVAFAAGQSVRFQVEAPDFPAFLHVDYFDREGQVLHLRPNSLTGVGRAVAAQMVTIGEGDGLDIRVAPPFGLDLVVVIATSRPLFTKSRPLQEPAATYLTELVGAFDSAHSEGSFRAEYAWLFVRTHP